MPKKNAFNKQVEDVAIELFQQRRERWMLANPTKDEADYNAMLAKQKTAGVFSWKNIRTIKFDGQATLWSLIVKDPRVVAAKENMPANLFATDKRTGKDWWDIRQHTILPIKTKAVSGGVAVGQVTAKARKNHAGSAALATMNGLGLRLLFDDADELLLACESLRVGSGEEFDDLLGGFDEETATKKAVEKLEMSLKSASERFGVAAVLFTNGLSVLDFVDKYRNDADGLKQLTSGITRNYAESMRFTEQSDGDYIRAFDFDLRNSLLNIIASFDTIKKSVIDGKFIAVYDNKSRLRLLEKAFERANVENCVGSELAKGSDGSDFRKVYTTDGNYIIEAFPDGDEMIIIDMNSSKDEIDELYKGIFVPGTKRKARLIKCNMKKGSDGNGQLITYCLFLRDANRSQIKFRLHRLLQIQRHSAGNDFDQSEVVQNHLDLKPGQHFEEAAFFRFAPLSERAIRQLKLRVSYLKRRGWKELEFGELTDVDHMAGRSKLWMNSTLFTMHTSHSWNQYIGFIRMLFGRWGFGCGVCKYGSGND